MDDHEKFYVEFGRRVRRAREKIGLTQEALATLVSLTRTSITNIEKGRQKIVIHTLVDLATALKTSCTNLLPEQGLSPDEKPIEQWLKGSSAKERAWAKSVLATRKEQ